MSWTKYKPLKEEKGVLIDIEQLTDEEMKSGIKEICDFINAEYDRIYKETFEELNKVKQSIKHPHFYYAIYYIDTKEIIYRKKKWYKWLSGKRVVNVSVAKITVNGVASYED